MAVLFVALAAVPAGAGSDAAREEAAQVVRAHEQARERADRLREADADDPKTENAERHRKALRTDLWDLLRTTARGVGDPVAVDPSGRAGHCSTRDRSDLPEQHSRMPEDGSHPAGDRSHPLDESSHAPEARSHPSGPRTVAWTAPTRGYWLSAGYADKGTRWAHRHTGQDFAVPTGTPVYAVGPGTVRVTTCGDGFGHQVLVRHDDGYFTQYAHLSRIDVRKGERVTAGQRLGLSGATGNVTGPHLHFEVRITPYMGSAVPPLPWLRRKAVEVVPDGQLRRSAEEDDPGSNS
jgi:murein DD-endopeptidase MepM/ murein hydrolase activator NlpD